jgi:hypothetical protein
MIHFYFLYSGYVMKRIALPLQRIDRDGGNGPFNPFLMNCQELDPSEKKC